MLVIRAIVISLVFKEGNKLWEDVVDQDVGSSQFIQSIVGIGAVKNVGKNKPNLQGKVLTRIEAMRYRRR